jgi:lycopene beta-cyclase
MGQSRHEEGPNPANAPTYVRAGLAGGAARPSTGYAFQRIQRWADLCAAQLAAGKLPVAHPADPPLLRALDHLFLSVLRSRPERAPSLFLALFEKTSTPRMIRFLSDRATPLDYASVVWALPFLLFIQEIPRALAAQAGQPQESLIT